MKNQKEVYSMYVPKKCWYILRKKQIKLQMSIPWSTSYLLATLTLQIRTSWFCLDIIERSRFRKQIPLSLQGPLSSTHVPTSCPFSGSTCHTPHWMTPHTLVCSPHRKLHGTLVHQMVINELLPSRKRPDILSPPPPDILIPRVVDLTMCSHGPNTNIPTSPCPDHVTKVPSPFSLRTPHSGSREQLYITCRCDKCPVPICSHSLEHRETLHTIL